MMHRWLVVVLAGVPLVGMAQVGAQNRAQTADAFPAEYDFSEFKFQMPPLPERLKQEQLKQEQAQTVLVVEEVPTTMPASAPVSDMAPTPASDVLQALPTSATVPYHLRGGVSFSVDELPQVASNTSMVPAAPVGLAASTRVQAAPTARTFLRQNTVALLSQQQSKPLPLHGMWQGTPYGYAKTLLSQLVETLPQRDTGSQLLLLRVLVPVLAAEEAGLPMEATDAQWRATRADLLLQLGQARLAYKLLQQVDTAALGRNPELAKVWVQTSLMAGETERGCGFVRQQVLNVNEGFWPRALMVCQALQAQAGPLGLSLQTLDDDKRAQDPTLYGVLEATLSGAEQVEHVGAIRPLHAVLYAAYPDFLTIPLVAQLPDMMAQRVRDTSQLPLNMRILAAERVVQLAPLGKESTVNIIAALAKLYDGAEFEVGTVQNPLDSAKKLQEDGKNATSRALLWQAAAYGKLPSARAQALQALWASAKAEGLTHLPLLLLPRQRSLLPEATLAWFAPEVMQTALLAGDEKSAKDWALILQNNQNVAPLENQRVLSAQLVLAFTAQGLQSPQAAFTGWWPTQQAIVQDAPYVVEQKLAMLQNLGVTVEESAWQGVYAAQLTTDQRAAGTSFSWLRQVAHALQNQHKGTALLMALMPLAQQNITAVNSTELVNMLKIFTVLKMEALQNLTARVVLLAE